MTPQLRFPEFTDEWQVKKIGDTGNVITGSTPVTADRTLYGSEYQFISPGDMNSGRYVISTKQRLSQKGFDISRKIKTGSTLFVCIGSTIGKTAQVSEMSVTNQQINAVVTNDNHDDDFVYLALSKISTKIALSAGAQAVPIISKSDFSKNIIHIPSKPEQEKIADFLTAVDERIAVSEKKLELLETYKRGVMQKIFSQQVRFKDENGEDYPEWEEKQLGSLVEIKKGTQLNGDTLTKDGNYPMLNGGMSPSGFTDSYNSDANTVTISEGGNSCGHVSYMSEKFWSGGHLYTLVDLKIDDKFVYQLLKFKQDEIMRLRVGSGLPNIQKGDLAKLRLYIPKLNEQQKIATFLTALDDKITAEKSKLTATRQFKKALLQRMFV